MPWKLEHKPHRHFARNALATVVTQLRFHPILKVEAKVPDFQEAVRPHFPVFGTQLSRQVNIAMGEGIELHEEKTFLFSTTERDLTVSLGTASIALEAKHYTHHKEFLAKAEVVFAALENVYKPIVSTRLGLRYVNIIKRSVVADGLGRSVGWEDLVTDEFLRVPGVVDLDGTRFSSEVTSSMPSGVLTLRHGLLDNPPQGEHFRFDMDRYVEARVEVASTREVLEGFADDLYALFDGMVGPALTEWMEPIDAG